MGGIFFQALVGAAGGLLAWACIEPMFPRNYGGAEWGAVELRLILLIGALVGGGIGAVRGFRQGSRVHLLRSAAIGLVFGAVGATFGYSFGGQLKNAIFPGVSFTGGETILMRLPARILALAPIGLFLGAAIGAGGWTWKRLTVGAIGGLLGGLLAGATFDIIAELVSPLQLAVKGGDPVTGVGGFPALRTETGNLSRALTSLLIGGAVGLFIGIVERATRTAWVRQVLGRNEGREWIVDAPQTFLGRSETAQIPLFGDPNVAPMHACITRQGEAYLLMDGGSPVGTGLNGQRISQAPLFDGAQIQVGHHTLIFMMKQGSAPQRAAEAHRAQSYYPAGAAAVPQPSAPFVPHPTSQSAPSASFGGPLPTSQPTQVVSPLPSPNPILTLVAVGGPLTGQRFPVQSILEAGREAIGIALGFDTAASRRHASFAPVPGGVLVTDLGSTNGTFVNDQRVQSQTLRYGDSVRIGGSTFRVE